MTPFDSDPQASFFADWLAPTALVRARSGERVGHFDWLTGITAGLAVIVLGWCAIDRGPWALLPLPALLCALGLAPLALRHGIRSEYWAFTTALTIFASFAVAAAMTGGPLSPVAYLLPVGVSRYALRGTPRATRIGAIVSVSVFLTACLLT